MEEPAPGTARFGRRTKVLLGLAVGLVVAVMIALLLVPGPDATLVDIASIEDLRTPFNEDRGAPRIVLLVSPT